MIDTFSELPNWTFDVAEVSGDVYLIRAIDRSGHSLRHEGAGFVSLMKAAQDEAYHIDRKTFAATVAAEVSGTSQWGIDVA